MPDKGDVSALQSLPHEVQQPTKDAGPKAADPTPGKVPTSSSKAPSTSSTTAAQPTSQPTPSNKSGPPFASLPPRTKTADSEPLDPLTESQIAQSDYVYEHVLRYLDWNAKYPPSKPVFQPFHFFQPSGLTSAGIFEPSSTKVAASRWARDGSTVKGQALWISQDSREAEVKAWAKLQGKNGRLCPDVLMIEGKRVMGQILLVD